MVVSPYWEDIYPKFDRGIYYKTFQNAHDLGSINQFLVDSETTQANVTSALVVKWVNVCPYGNQDCLKVKHICISTSNSSQGCT